MTEFAQPHWTETEFSMPHWTDPVAVAVAEALYDDLNNFIPPFPRSEAVKYWPGAEARKFVAMMRAYAEATTASASGYEAATPRSETQTGGHND